MAKKFAEHNGLNLTQTNNDVLAAWEKNAIFLDEQMALTHGVLWNATQGCVVAITDILSKCQVYQLVF